MHLLCIHLSTMIISVSLRILETWSRRNECSNVPSHSGATDVPLIDEEEAAPSAPPYSPEVGARLAQDLQVWMGFLKNHEMGMKMIVVDMVFKAQIDTIKQVIKAIPNKTSGTNIYKTRSTNTGVVVKTRFTYHQGFVRGRRGA